MFTGTYTAIVTPFKNGKLDERALANLIRAQVKGGVDGIVPVGTTGESPTLDYDEHSYVIEQSVKIAAGRIKVIAGTGGNSTTEAVYLTERAAKAGADASLQVAPYYNKPSQEGLYQHFRKVSESTKLPIILYSIPARCGVEIAVIPWQGSRATAKASSPSRKPAAMPIASASCARPQNQAL